MKLSVISPVYKAADCVDELISRTVIGSEEITSDYEIILVDDGCPEGSWEKIKENCLKNSKIRGIKLSRNFGQHYALNAGLESASGDLIIILDCDLQDDPKYFKKFFNHYKKGYDIVFSKIDRKNHTFFKNITASIYTSIFNYLLKDKSLNSDTSTNGFTMFSSKVKKAYLDVNDYHRHYLYIMRWIGFKHGFITIKHNPRYAGQSSYTFKKLLSHALNGITSQSNKLLKLTIYLGFFLSFLSLLASFYIFIKAFYVPFKPGWASTSILILLMGGLIIFSVGIAGIYIGKTFEQSKQRPLYIIDETLN